MLQKSKLEAKYKYDKGPLPPIAVCSQLYVFVCICSPCTFNFVGSRHKRLFLEIVG